MATNGKKERGGKRPPVKPPGPAAKPVASYFKPPAPPVNPPPATAKGAPGRMRTPLNALLSAALESSPTKTPAAKVGPAKPAPKPVLPPAATVAPAKPAPKPVLPPAATVAPAKPIPKPVLPLVAKWSLTKPAPKPALPPAATAVPAKPAPKPVLPLAAKAVPAKPIPKPVLPVAATAAPAKPAPTPALPPAATTVPARPVPKPVLPPAATVAPAKPAPKPVLPATPPPLEPALPVPLPAPRLEPFAGPEPAPAGYVDRGQPIPDTYGMDRLVCLVRDPQWIFCYWELTGDTLKRLRAQRGPEFVDRCAWVLRLYRVQEDLAIDLEVEANAGNWYLHVGRPGPYQVELGLLSPEGEFVSLLASQVVLTPPETPSDRYDEEWRLKARDEQEFLRRLLGELGLTDDARKRGGSGFLGASGLPSSWPAASWRLPGSFLGASGVSSGGLGVRSSGAGASGGALGASWSGPAASGQWVSSFLGASDRPGSAGSGGFMNVGWIIGADGRHEVLLLRPTREGGPNWHLQAYLPGRRSGAHFKVRLPRVLKGVARPAPTWPPPSRSAAEAGAAVAPAVVPWVHPAPVPVGGEPAPGPKAARVAPRARPTRHRTAADSKKRRR